MIENQKVKKKKKRKKAFDFEGLDERKGRWVRVKQDFREYLGSNLFYSRVLLLSVWLIRADSAHSGIFFTMHKCMSKLLLSVTWWSHRTWITKGTERAGNHTRGSKPEIMLSSCYSQGKKMPDHAYHGRKFRDANGLKSSHNPSSEQAPGYASAVRRLAPD